jgi:hypothetical protein
MTHFPEILLTQCCHEPIHTTNSRGLIYWCNCCKRETDSEGLPLIIKYQPKSKKNARTKK